MADDTARGALAARIRGHLQGREVREVSMFGGLSFMVDGTMAVAARRGGALLVRLDPERAGELGEAPGAGAALMGERPMGASWLEVSADAATDADTLGFWIGAALDR